MKYTRLALLVLGCSAMGFDPASAAAQSFGEARLLSRIDASPGFPEGVVVRGRRAYVSGPATFGTAGGPPSVVNVFETRHGTRVRTFEIEGEDLSQEHAISGMAADAWGRLYIASTQLGIVRLWPFGRGRQSVYASIPDLPPCNAAPAPCSEVPVDLPPLPNDLAFDAEGNLYVTDTLQAVIFRIPPGGEAEVWFSDPRLISDFGPNGIRVTPDGQHVVFGVSGPPGFLYRLPVCDAPGAADLETLAELGFEGPDGLAFARSGNLYVTLAFSNQIVTLSPDGEELARTAGPITTPTGTLPFDGPAVLAFDGRRRRLIVVNHAIVSGNADNFAVFELETTERGARLFEPWSLHP